MVATRVVAVLVVFPCDAIFKMLLTLWSIRFCRRDSLKWALVVNLEVV